MFSFWKELDTKTAVASAELIFGFAVLCFSFTKDASFFALPATFSIAHAICKLGEGQGDIPYQKMKNK